MSHTVVQEYQKKYAKEKIPTLKPGMTVKVTHKFKEGTKERSQLFQGVIIKMHEVSSLNATFTVRKMVDGIGVEKIFPIHAPMIEVEVIRSSRVRRAKLYHLRARTGKSARLKEKNRDFGELLTGAPVVPTEEQLAEVPAEPVTEAPAEAAAE